MLKNTGIESIGSSYASRVRKNSQGRNKFGKGLPSSQGWDPDLVGEREIVVHRMVKFCELPFTRAGKHWARNALLGSGKTNVKVGATESSTYCWQASCLFTGKLSGKHLPDSDATAGDHPHTTDGKPQEQEGPGGMKKECVFLCYTLQYPSCTLPTKHNIAPDGKREMCLQIPD